MAYKTSQDHARALLTALTSHLDEHAASMAQYPGNLSYDHAEYIDEISGRLLSILVYAKRKAKEVSD